MEPAESISSKQKSRKADDLQSPSCGLLKPRLSGSRVVFWLMIAGAFIVVDLAILFYVLWSPTVPEVPTRLSQPPAVIEKAANGAGPQSPK